MRTQTIKTAAVIAAAALAVGGTAGAAAATSGAPATTVRTFTVYSFDINGAPADPGIVPVPGTSPSKYAQGDQLILNDQITTTTKVGGGYPIIGRDAGVCTLTRIPEPNASQTLANCVSTTVIPGGTLTAQGVVSFRSQQPQPAVVAITGGTGQFAGAKGTVTATFTKDFRIETFRLTGD